MELINAYLNYLVEKLLIIDDGVEVDNIDTLKNKINLKTINKKTTNKNVDIMILEMTNLIMKHFDVYDILENKVVPGEIYEQYKTYKQKLPEKSKSIELQLKCNKKIDTSSTFYVDTLDGVTTSWLKDKYGDLVMTGQKDDKHRYEYKFKINKTIFSIYDWLDENGNKQDINDIVWHLGCNTNNKNSISKFINIFKYETNCKDNCKNEDENIDGECC